MIDFSVIQVQLTIIFIFTCMFIFLYIKTKFPSKNLHSQPDYNQVSKKYLTTATIALFLGFLCSYFLVKSINIR